MKHKVFNKKDWGSTTSIYVKLIAETTVEKKALENLETYTATQQEHDLVSDYVNFNIKVPGYIVVEAGQVIGDEVELIARMSNL